MLATRMVARSRRAKACWMVNTSGKVVPVATRVKSMLYLGAGQGGTGSIGSQDSGMVPPKASGGRFR